MPRQGDRDSRFQIAKSPYCALYQSKLGEKDSKLVTFCALLCGEFCCRSEVDVHCT